MNKKFLKFGTIALSACLCISAVSGLAACGGNTNDVEIGDDGKPRPGADGPTEISFWGYGDQNEKEVFTDLVNQFNELYKDTIKVKYEHKPGDYNTAALNGLRASRANVDVLYVDDEHVKRYAKAGYLEPLDSYIQNSEEIQIDNMWASSINRYKYDVDTTTQDGPNAHYWGIPKDIGPVVIFYNESMFNRAGVKVISVAKEDLAAFNAGTKADARGTTKSEYGITGEVKEKGYFVDGTQKWFNNQIPMSWDECVALSTVVQTSERTLNGITTESEYFGYYTEWWFNYGWSVGGDCVEYVATDDPAYKGGYWEFTLLEDDTPNYIVKDDVTEPVTVKGHSYSAGQIIEWADKIQDPKTDVKAINSEVTQLYAAGKLNELPSQRDAMIEFGRLCTKKDVEVVSGKNGYRICPYPADMGGNDAKATTFAEGKLGMLVDGRWNVTNFRKLIGEKPGQTGNKFEWDVAPLPMYKEYDASGNVTVHGVEAGHSGSVALCVNAKSKKKNAAWFFAEFIGGKTGQEAQAKSGFAIPSQKNLANSEVFLQSDKNPRNSIVFVRAAEYETPGDWWYLEDNLWIADWADLLNSQFREGKITLEQLQANSKYKDTPNRLKDYTEA